MKKRMELEQRYIDKGIWQQITLGEKLKKLSEMYKDNIGVIDGDERFTYRQLDQESDAMAAGLKEYGFNKGDKVVVQLPNSWQFVVVSFALFKLGVIPIMALPAHREMELKGIFEISEAVGYFIQDRYLGYDYREMARNLQKSDNKLEKIIVNGDPQEFVSLSSIKSYNTDFQIDSRIDFKDIAMLLLSGGTTGIPKLIPRRHTDYLYVAHKTAQRCEMNQSTVYLAALPIGHNFPLGCPGLIGTLLSGGKVVMCKTTSPDEIIPLIEEEKVTITGLVPTMATMCIEFLKYDDSYNLSSLRVVQIGGAVLDSKIAYKIMNTFNCTLQQIFGIAEGLICCTNLQDTAEIICSCQGKPISEEDEILIIDENGQAVSDGEFGELIVRGPYTIYGYYNLPEINKKVINANGYFCTGDKARKLGDGNYQIAGRLKEQINRAGEKITPSELEDLLLQHKEIKDAQVVGVKDDNLGEKICVFIIMENRKLTLNEVRVFLAEKGLATFKMPDQVIYIESWPLTSVGKINKKKLKMLA